MRTKIQLSDAMGHLKGLRVTLANSSHYVKTVRQWLTYLLLWPCLNSPLKSKVSRLFSIKFQIWPGWIQEYIIGPKPKDLEPRMRSPSMLRITSIRILRRRLETHAKSKVLTGRPSGPDSVTDFRLGPVISSVKTINSRTVSSPNSRVYSISRGPLDAKHLGFLGLELQVKCLSLVSRAPRTEDFKGSVHWWHPYGDWGEAVLLSRVSENIRHK